MKYIEDTMIFVNSSVLETMVWMSIRYALGRHTIAATMHAADLFKVINDLKDKSNYKTEQFAYDIRENLANILSKYDNVKGSSSVDFINSSKPIVDPFSLFYDWVIKNYPDGISSDEAKKYVFTYSNNELATAISENKPDTYSFRFDGDFCNFGDYAIWIKLANFIDKQTHKSVYIESEDETYEVFPFYDMRVTTEGKYVIKKRWVNVESVLINPPFHCIYFEPDIINPLIENAE